MVATSLFSTVIFFLSIICIPPSTQYHVKTTSDGFSVRLIHRDSPLSPFYNHSITTIDRIRSAVHRSISRLNYLHSLTTPSLVSDMSSKLIYDNTEYIMMYYLGTPPTQVYAIVDTGSELIWLQCLPCKHCYRQTQPIFDPSKSSTYEKIQCDSSACETLRGARCTKDFEACYYSQIYGDGSTTKGTLSYDAFTFEDPQQNMVEIGNLVFGCSDQSSGFPWGNQAGIVGLNRESHSLVSQLDIKRFSYCMVPRDDEGSGSRMYFGSLSVTLGGQTPFLERALIYYYLTLDGISVGEERVPIPDGVSDITPYGEGGFIIDSGVTYTMLRSEALVSLVKALSKVIHLPRKKSKLFGLCFEGSFDDLDLAPDVTFHFYGADVVLTKQATYVEQGHRLWCLAMLPSNYGLSILGNFQQQNYYVGYDLEARVISFAPVECATF